MSIQDGDDQETELVHPISKELVLELRHTVSKTSRPLTAAKYPSLRSFGSTGLETVFMAELLVELKTTVDII